MLVSELSDEQKKILLQFRENVKDIPFQDDSDGFLLRWLVARNFQPEAAERMIRQSMEWRKMNAVDQIVANWKPPEVLTKFLTMSPFSVDKMGSPVWINVHGRCDLRGIFESVSIKDFVRYHVYLQELLHLEMRRLSEVEGKPVTQGTLIYDVEHLSWWQITCRAAVESGREIVKMSEAHYPETMRRVFVINAPKIFTIGFALLKPFIHPNTVKKISIFDHNAEQWKAALLREIDADQLPVHYGGTLTDPDGNPMCSSKICFGGQVPRSYYLTKSKPQPTNDMDTVVIARGSKKTIQLHVKVPDSTLKWRFLSEQGDVAFHVFYEDDGKTVDVIPKNRVDCHQAVEEGVVACSCPATYVVEFDNSFSYLRSKKLWYSVAVTEPSTEQI